MLRELPLTVDAHKLAKQGTNLSGVLRLANLLRIADLLENKSGQLMIDLRFEISHDHLHYVHGQISGDIEIQCQRCMEAMSIVVDNQFVLGLMDNPEIAKRLPENIEPIYLDQGELDISGMIEDELILALPLIAMHDLDECAARDHMQSVSINEECVTPGKKDNPFAILKNLKK